MTKVSIYLFEEFEGLAMWKCKWIVFDYDMVIIEWTMGKT